MKNYKLIFLLVLIFIGVFIALNANKQNNASSNQPAVQNTPPSQTEPPKIISTKPDPLEESIIGASEVVEITFNRSLENKGEFKLRIEPKVEYKIELTQDRKTAKIIPLAPYALGTTYTIFIGPDSKFDGVGEWRQEKIFHFKTIRYRGV